MSEMGYFACLCKRKKEFALTFDGGSSGKYVLEICKKCRAIETDDYLLREEII